MKRAGVESQMFFGHLCIDELDHPAGDAEVGTEFHAPFPGSLSVARQGIRHRQIVAEVAGVEDNCAADLLEVTGTGCRLCPSPRLIECRQQQRGKDGDDRDNNE